MSDHAGHLATNLHVLKEADALSAAGYESRSSEFTHCVDAGPAKGMRFRICMPEDKGIWTGTYEFAFALELAKSTKPGSIACGVGGWHGFFPGVMVAQGTAQVHAFEPLPQNAERVAKLIALSPSKTIKLHACAVGDNSISASADGHAGIEHGEARGEHVPGARRP
jgi:hypothetical protein